MNLFREKLRSSPVYARFAPFVIFLVLTFFQGGFGGTASFWFYIAKTLVGAWFIWEMRPFVAEMRWAFSWEALVVGVAVFVMWVGIDPIYPHVKVSGAPWNPFARFPQDATLAWTLIVIRILGMTFVVPPLEEVSIIASRVTWTYVEGNIAHTTDVRVDL